MSDGEQYVADEGIGGGVWNKRTGKYVSTDAPKSKVPTYRHAQKEAMKRGDSNTYNMRKTASKKATKRGSK
jgi:hypothetical protein